MCKSCRGFRPDRRDLVLKLAPAFLLASGSAVLFAPVRARAAALELPAPKSSDVCPVCGMFVAKYRYWIATVLYQDGHADHFDGAKDFFRYLLDMKKYAGGRRREQIARMGVTGYYEGTRIDAATAVYVLGSDVLGPMGHELVPHEDEAEAKEFMTDHKGRRIFRFAEVTPELLDALDRGKFE
jgi:nitrous oxide reductase accessory protein NosL